MDYRSAKKNTCLYIFGRLIPTAALVIAVDKMPIDYYVILRWYIFISGAISAYIEYSNDDCPEQYNARTVVLLSAVIIFNPIYPLYFSKTEWIGFDFLYIIAFIILFIGDIILCKLDNGARNLYKYIKVFNFLNVILSILLFIAVIMWMIQI